MEYFDKELLETKRELKHQNHTTLQTGIYAGKELITFSQITLPGSNICLPLPDQFIVMPENVKRVKYPSREAPAIVMTSLDSTINIGFNLLSVLLHDGEIKFMDRQIQNALQNINPSIIIKNQTNTKTEFGNEMSWFEYKGYHLDGQSYNRIYLIRMRKTVLHGNFSCQIIDKQNWENIVDKIFLAVKEGI